MIQAKLAVMLRLRLYTPKSSQSPFLDLEHNTRLCTRQSYPFKGKPETGDVPGYRQ